MNEEFYFYCDVCHAKFSADPETILECNTHFKVINENGKELPEDSYEYQEAVKCAEKDPEIKPFMRNTICMCLKCQENF